MTVGNWTAARQLTKSPLELCIVYRAMFLQSIAPDEWFSQSVTDWAFHCNSNKRNVGRALARLREAGVILSRTESRRGIRTSYHRANMASPSCQYGATHHATVALPIKGKQIEEEESKMKTYGLMKPPSKKVVSEVKPIDGRPIFSNARKVWSIYWHKNYEGPVDGFPDSPKTRKMFRDWVGKVPSDRKPLHLIASAVDNWSEFRDITRSRTGKKLPEHPVMWALLANLPSLLDVGDSEGAIEQVVPKKGDMSPHDRLKKLMAK